MRTIIENYCKVIFIVLISRRPSIHYSCYQAATADPAVHVTNQPGLLSEGTNERKYS
jgi:hypothetical protein